MLLKDGVNMDAQRLQSELVQMVRAQVGGFANFQAGVGGAAAAEDAIRQDSALGHSPVADGVPFNVLSAIDDPAILDEIAAALRKR